MVRYRPEAGERGYTFRLNNHSGGGEGVNGVSPTGTLLSEHSNASTLESSVYKERIDSLFRYNLMQQHQRNKNSVSRPPEEEEEAEEPTMEHLQQHFQKVLAEQHRSKTPVSCTSSTKNHSTTYIQVSNKLLRLLPPF